MIINNAFYDFIDYCVLGIKTFNNKISYINLIKSDEIIIKILSIIIPISWIFMFKTSITKKDKKLFIIMVISIAEFVVTFPISDNIHFLIGSIPSIIGITYLFYKFITNIKLKNNKQLFFKFYVEYASILVIAITLFYGIYINYKYFVDEKNFSNLNHFSFIQISEDLENSIKNVEQYIKNSNEKVYILDSDAALYMIPIDIYNKDYDMFNKGNIGSRGEEGKIEELQKQKNIKVLIRKDGLSLNWQTPKDVRKYVKENLTKIDDIEIYSIYLKE